MKSAEIDKNNNAEIAEGYIATVGTFDGVHSGHLYLLRQLREEAHRAGLRPLAMVLDPHPLTLVRPDKVPPQLCDFEQRRIMIQREGIEVRKLSFTEQTRRETSAEFLRKLSDEMEVKSIIVGYDNHFGSDRENGFDYYQKIGRQLGMKVIEARCLPGVSSSAVRRQLLAGNIDAGNALLGYAYGFEGTVVHGDALGRELGYPTANIRPLHHEQLIPPAGVYSSMVSIDETGIFMPSMTNIGYRPTVASGKPELRIETHIFNFDNDLYDHRVRLHFKGRVRDEKKFDSIEQLKAQLELDAQVIKTTATLN
ncbi:MAG: riboflavin biosynthesis protein RibF [Muribaculaceae bacterium]|nr:riboflavin biosynthesis protein RibF [Muribaculaceae bacterium]